MDKSCGKSDSGSRRSAAAAAAAEQFVGGELAVAVGVERAQRACRRRDLVARQRAVAVLVERLEQTVGRRAAPLASAFAAASFTASGARRGGLRLRGGGRFDLVGRQDAVVIGVGAVEHA